MPSGVYARDRKNLIGLQFGKLTVTGHASPSNNGKSRYYVLCECGVVKIIPKNRLSTGGAKSCGCLQKDAIRKQGFLNRIEKGLAAFNVLLGHYKLSAKTRGINFLLSADEFKILTSSPCHYCGRPPFAEAISKGTKKYSTLNGNYIYSGIDRRNSDSDYVLANCVPCCRNCNYAKRDLSYEDFIQYLDTLVEYRAAS